MAEQNLTPRPAATLLLLREAEGAPEVFMLQRTSKAAFLPGAFVFPGGALDADDAGERAARRVLGLDDAQASARLGVPSGGLAYWIAAARECFEESGILLAFDRKDLPVGPKRADALEPFRKELNAGSLLFSEFLERENLYIHAQDIAYYSHWITAPGRARRFSTRFFVACAPAGQHGAHDRSETVHSVWVSPREALERDRRKEIELIFPTRSTLADLAGFGCGIIGLAELALLAVDRRDVDDAAELALAHAFDHLPRHVEQRAQIGVDHRVPLLGLHPV